MAALSVARADREATEGGFLDSILTVRVVDDPCLVDRLGDALLLGNAAACGQ